MKKAHSLADYLNEECARYLLKNSGVFIGEVINMDVATGTTDHIDLYIESVDLWVEVTKSMCHDTESLDARRANQWNKLDDGTSLIHILMSPAGGQGKHHRDFEKILRSWIKHELPEGEYHGEKYHKSSWPEYVKCIHLYGAFRKGVDFRVITSDAQEARDDAIETNRGHLAECINHKQTRLETKTKTGLFVYMLSPLNNFLSIYNDVDVKAYIRGEYKQSVKPKGLGELFITDSLLKKLYHYDIARDELVIYALRNDMMPDDVFEGELKHLDAMVAIASSKRDEDEKAQPFFWRRAETADQSLRVWLEKCLGNPKKWVFVATQYQTGDITGFIIGKLEDSPAGYAPGGKIITIDDFCVATSASWEDTGGLLLDKLVHAGRGKGGSQVLVVAGEHEEAKWQFLQSKGLSLASRGYVKKI